jgi:phospholipase C
VPALLVSAYAKEGYIDSTLLDYTSALKFIEENWGLEPLARRDANANSIANAFDFNQPARPAEIIPMERFTTVEEKEPNRNIIFVSYGSALVFSGGIVALAQFWSRDTTTKLSPRSLRRALKKRLNR